MVSKQLRAILLIIFVFFAMVNSGFAQTGGPNPDRDGDGLPDSVDDCDTQAGPRTNNGCPEQELRGSSSTHHDDIPPDSDGDGTADGLDICPDLPGDGAYGGCPVGTDPNNPTSPAFVAPILSNDACFVTARGDYRTQVRVFPDISAAAIGYLLPGVVYPAIGIETIGDEQWLKLAGEFEYFDYEASAGLDAYVAHAVVLASNCPDLARSELAPSIDELACTVVTAYDWIFAFNYAAGEAIPLGSHPIAIINGDLDLAGNPENWTATIFESDPGIEYMRYADWGSFPRTGGTCGTIADANITTIGIFVPAPNAQIEYSNQFGIIVQTEPADCNNNGIDDLDEFWPPDCFGKISADGNNNQANSDGFDPNSQADIDLAWAVCPEGWIVHEDSTLECHDFQIEDD